MPSSRVDYYDALTGSWSSDSQFSERSMLAATTWETSAFFGGGDTYAFSTSTLQTYDPGLGTNYCVANPNSTGSPASISAEGSPSLSADDFTLRASPVPDRPFLYFFAPDRIDSPFGDGHLCAGGGIVRIGPPGVASGQVAERGLSPATLGIAAGSIQNFQCWFRDPDAGGTGFNTSDGLAVAFLP